MSVSGKMEEHMEAPDGEQGKDHSQASCLPRPPIRFSFLLSALANGSSASFADPVEATDAAGLASLMARDALALMDAVRVVAGAAAALASVAVDCAALMALKSRTAPLCASLRNSLSLSAPPVVYSTVASPSSMRFHWEKGRFGLAVHPAITSDTWPRSSRSCRLACSSLSALLSNASSEGGGCNGRRGRVGAGAEMREDSMDPKTGWGRALLRSG